MAQQQTPAAGSGTPTHPPVATTTPPAIGQYWPEARGIYAGPMAYPDGSVAGLVWANDLADQPAMPWGETGKTVPGAVGLHDGLANTEAMAAAGSALAQTAIAAEAYIPTRIEALQLFAALADQIGPIWCWTSTQHSASFAWLCYFLNGHQHDNHKSAEGSVVAVRRLVLQCFGTSASAADKEGGAA